MSSSTTPEGETHPNSIEPLQGFDCQFVAPPQLRALNLVASNVTYGGGVVSVWFELPSRLVELVAAWANGADCARQMNVTTPDLTGAILAIGAKNFVFTQEGDAEVSFDVNPGREVVSFCISSPGLLRLVGSPKQA